MCRTFRGQKSLESRQGSYKGMATDKFGYMSDNKVESVCRAPKCQANVKIIHL